MNKVSSWLWGLVLVALGVVLGVNALGLAQINIFFPGWWTLFIIVPCFIGLICNDGDRWGDIIGLLIGAALLLACQGWVAFSTLWKLIVPVTLIVIGLSLMFRGVLKNKIMKEVKKLKGHSGGKEYWATFGGQNVNFANEKFEGCRLEAVFGGIKCDLREAKIEDDVLIRASSVFGGVTILLPKDVNVKVVSSSIFGGVTNHYNKKTEDETKKTVFIEATCVFAGVEIK